MAHLPLSLPGLLGADPAPTRWTVIPTGFDTATYEMTGNEAPVPDLTKVLPGDTVIVVGSLFNPLNRGSFSVVSVDIEADSQSMVLTNPKALSQSNIPVTVDDVYIFRPHRATVNDFGSRAVIVAQTPTGLDVVIPATTDAITRGVGTGAYLHAAAGVDITSASRDVTGLVTVIATAHDLTTGDRVEIDSLYPDNTVVPSIQFVIVPDDDSGWFTAASMNVSRTNYTLTRLQSGKILAAGGNSGALSAELYDEATNTWTMTGGDATTRSGHTATLLSDGRVLAVGGTSSASAIIYTPATGLWTAAATPSTTRTLHSATLLNDGRVLIAGGKDVSNTPLSSCEIYDPNQNVWIPCTAMSTARIGHTANLCQLGISGDVFVIGGTASVGGVGLVTCERFIEGSLTWASAGALIQGHAYHATTPLKDGTLLVTGGITISADVAACEIYNPITQTSALTASMNNPRSSHSIVTFPNFQVVVSGGTSNSTEEYQYPIAPIAAGGLNGRFTVTVVDANTFTYQTPDFPYLTTALAGGVVTSTAATSNGIPGPYIFDPDAGSSVTAVETTVTQDLVLGQAYKSITVTDATEFPDSEGYLLFDFAQDSQVGPVHYLGTLSSTTLLLDPSFHFPSELNSGATVTLLTGRSPFVPVTPQTAGCFYLTASAAGRVAAEQTVQEMAAGGINLNVTIVYPGDRGLGNEGLPALDSTKLSDKVVVWGSDEIDAEVATLREG